MTDEKNKKWWNFFSDNGVPVPLIRHKGRGDLVATAMVLSFATVLTSLLFNGSEVFGLTIAEIPEVVVLTVLGSVTTGYVWKRSQDKTK